MSVRLRGRASAVDAVLWLVWLALTGVALLGAVRTGRSVPLATDWSLVEPVTGNSESLVDWLWTQEQDNRAPLPRLLLTAGIAATKSFLVGPLLALAALAVASATLLVTLRRLRGGVSRVSDAFLPLLLLGPSHWALLGWARVLEPALTAALAVALLAVIVSDPTLRRRGWGVAAGVLMVLLPLSGTAGAVIALASVPWISACGRHHWPPREPDVALETGPALILATLLVLALVLLYFAHFDGAAFGAAFGAAWATSLPVLARTALGVTGLAVPALAALLIGSAVILLRGYLRVEGAERYRAFGVVCFGAGTLLAELATGWSTVWRGGDVGIPVGGRLLASPLFAATYVAWELYAPPLAAVLCQLALLGLALIRTPEHRRHAAEHRAHYTSTMDALARDVGRLMPSDSLGVRYGGPLAGADSARVGKRIEMLRRAGFASFGPPTVGPPTPGRSSHP